MPSPLKCLQNVDSWVKTIMEHTDSIGRKSIASAERFAREVTDGTVQDSLLKIAVDTGISTNQLIDGMHMLEKADFYGVDGLKVLQSAIESQQGT